MGKTVYAKRLAAATLLLMPLVAGAAGLGRLTVLSQLGQPLNAEIELLSLQAGIEESLSARVASSDAFAQAGIEFSPALIGVRFALERKGGRPILRMTSTQPVNEPFLEVLVEMQWASGRLVREYSFLLDPPEYKGPQPIAAAPVPARPAVSPVAKPASIAPPRVEEKPIPAAPVAAPVAKPAPKPPGTHEVKKGDTLGRIAQSNLPPGVSLNQMLVALFRANQDAFINDNMNLLRSGRILTLPDRDAAAAVDSADAGRLVVAQGRDFADYQRKLGGEVARAPAAASPAQRSATGQIAGKPAAAAPEAPKDQLKLSKADPKKPAAAAAKAARGDDAVARARALKDAQSRVEELEKSVGDLRKLLELKNQQLAELEKRGLAAAPKPAAPVAAAKPEPATKAPEPPKPEAPKPEAPKPAPVAKDAPKPEAPKVADAKPAPPKPEAAKADAPKPAVDAPKAEPAKEPAQPPKPVADAAPKPPPKKPAPPPPPPPPPPSIVDQFLDNPLALGGLGGVAALLAGYGAWAWRRKKATQSKFQDSVLGAASAPGASDPVLGASQGAADLASISQTSVSQPSVGSGAADDVDPIAEADVYMAYGRDQQAEDILKEALAKDSSRAPVYGKLIEIYANRRDAKALEAAALKLKELTGGEGEDWDKAAALGRSVDPGNGLYGGSGGAAAAPVAAAAAAAAPSLDFDIGGGGDSGAASTDLSLDLGGGQEDAGSASALDFDLGGGSAEPEAAAPSGDSTILMEETAEAKPDAGGLDFDLGGGSEPQAQAAPEPEPVAAAPADGGMDFDLNLDGGSEPAPAPAPSASSEVDLSSIDLDLGGASTGEAAPEGGSEKWQEVATKLDLAKAYEEMGDKDGARDLLNEVLQEGDAAQKAQANQMIASLGG